MYCFMLPCLISGVSKATPNLANKMAQAAIFEAIVGDGIEEMNVIQVRASEALGDKIKDKAHSGP